MKRMTGLAIPIIALAAIGLVVVAVLAVRMRDQQDGSSAARQFESGGFVTKAAVRPEQVSAGSTVAIRASVVSKHAATGIVDIEVYGPDHQRLFQKFFDNQELDSGKGRTYMTAWDVPASEPSRLDTIKIGVFTPGWGRVSHWNDNAAVMSVSGGATSAASGSRTQNGAVGPPAGIPAFLGANIPWYNWACDFGCGQKGGVTDPATHAALTDSFQQAQTNGFQVLRWWMFEGDPWQITRDSAGGPAGINPAVYTDIDSALQLAEADHLTFDFVLFSAPSAIPSAWLTDPAQRQQLADTLAPLFARYRDNPHVWSWEIFNEPEWDIWKGAVDQSSVQATVQTLAGAVHSNSSASVTVGSAMIDGLPLWVGLGLDYYEAHWYDYMSSGNWCAICTDFAAVKARYKLDRPLVIGELPASPGGKPLERYTYLRSHGFAAAWPWSLFPDHTTDHIAIDLAAAKSFANGQTALGSPAVTTGGAPSAQTGISATVALERGSVAMGSTANLRISVASDAATSALVDVEVYGPDSAKAFQQTFDDLSLAPGQGTTLTATWQVPATAAPGAYQVKVGVFKAGWGTLYSWNDQAATLSVTGGNP
jgi:hypothetical protein